MGTLHIGKQKSKLSKFFFHSDTARNRKLENAHSSPDTKHRVLALILTFLLNRDFRDSFYHDVIFHGSQGGLCDGIHHFFYFFY